LFSAIPQEGFPETDSKLRGVSPAPTFSFSRIRVILSHTSHPGNIGAAARAMKTMGLSRLVLVNPRHFPDAQADAMAAGATDILASAQVVASLSEALAGTVLAVAMSARRRELAVPALWAREAAAELAAAATSMGEVALVFGNETAGLSNEDLLQCQRWAMIPVDPEFSSLNVAAAVQLMCYEIRLALSDPGRPPAISGAGLPATHDEVEHLVAHIEQAAIGSGFLDPTSPKRLMLRLRRMFARAVLEKEEVNILRGLLSALQAKPREMKDKED
jgi:tRNA/rRNA methyltransferase